MKSLKGTKTAENLLKSFAGESQARNRYEFYAKIADKEGYKQISNIFMETALNEKEHGKRFYKFLLAGLESELPAAITINDATYPVAQSTTEANLIAAAEGEQEEWEELYPHFADVATEEGFPEISTAYHMIAKAESYHEKRFRKLANNIKEKKVFLKDGKCYWKCGNCGYIHESDVAPTVCPACVHPQSYFEVFVETY